MTLVILLAYHFPPAPAVGGQRAFKVADALHAAGFDVHVITARLPDEQGQFRRREPRFTVETVRPWTNPRFWWVRLKSRVVARRPSAAPAEGPVTPRAPRTAVFWKRWISAMLWMPDDKQGFIPPAVRAALRARRPGENLLYTTVPPFSTHLAGLILSSLTGARWIAEFRDPWTDSHFRHADQRSALTTRLERALERACLRRAALVVSVSDGIDRKLREKLPPAMRGKFLVVRNGIERLLPRREHRAPSRPFRIVYVGSFYHRRDPCPFLEAISAVARRHELGPEQLALEFVGHCKDYSGIPIPEYARRHGVADLLSIREWVPKEEARDLVESADLLLLLAQEQPAQIPNKLYDYLGARVPILAFVDQDGESAEMLRLAGGHYLVYDNRVSEATTALATVMGLEGAPPTAASDHLDDWTVQRQMAALVSAVNHLRQPNPSLTS